MLDYSKLGRAVVRRLHDSAYSSNKFTPSTTHDERCDHVVEKEALVPDKSKAKMVFNKLKVRDCEISKVLEDEARLNALLAEREGSKNMPEVQQNKVYSAGFYAYIDQRRTVLGCKPLLYPDGQLSIPILCNTTLKLQESVMEDFIVFLCNNHSVFNCIYSCDGAPVDRTGNRLIYITQNCLAFFLSAVSGSVFDFVGLSDRANVVFDILVTTPATIAIAKVMKALYVCPVGFSVEYQAANSRIVTIVRWLGKLAIIPILAAISALLVLSAIFSRGYNTTLIIVSFFLQVQLFGFFLELILSGLMFLSTVYMRVTIDLSLRSILLLEVGRRYAEMIHHKGLLVEGRDYHYRCKYICCFLRIEYIYTFDDAVKKGYVQKVETLQSDVEMPVTSALHRQGSSALEDISGGSSLWHRPSSTTYGADELSIESSFHHDTAVIEDYAVNEGADRLSLSSVYSSVDSAGIPKFEQTSIVKPAEHWSRMRDAMSMPTDEELYREYHNELTKNGHSGHADSNNSGVDSISSGNYDFDEKPLSFEEWKVERKRFKEGIAILYSLRVTYSPEYCSACHQESEARSSKHSKYLKSES